jgi:hypothetical protein
MNDEYQSMAANAIAHAAHVAGNVWQEAAFEHSRPSVLFRPSLTKDGNMWCALYGEDIQIGVAGFGDTPDAAMREFDKAWGAKS